MVIKWSTRKIATTLKEIEELMNPPDGVKWKLDGVVTTWLNVDVDGVVTEYSFVLNCRGLNQQGEGGYFLIFIKWRVGNKMAYQENRNNLEGNRRVDDPTRWC